MNDNLTLAQEFLRKHIIARGCPDYMANEIMMALDALPSGAVQFTPSALFPLLVDFSFGNVGSDVDRHRQPRLPSHKRINMKRLALFALLCLPSIAPAFPVPKAMRPTAELPTGTQVYLVWPDHQEWSTWYKVTSSDRDWYYVISCPIYDEDTPWRTGLKSYFPKRYVEEAYRRNH